MASSPVSPSSSEEKLQPIPPDAIPWEPVAIADLDGLALVTLDHDLELDSVEAGNGVIIFNKQKRVGYPGCLAVALSESEFQRQRSLNDVRSVLAMGAHHETQNAPSEHPIFRTNREKYFAEILKKAQRLYDKDTLELILNGRIKMMLLLRTPGGWAPYVRRFAGAAAHWSSKRGTIHGIAIEEAMSAGASLMLVPDPGNRSTTPDTCFMWHTGLESRRKAKPCGFSESAADEFFNDCEIATLRALFQMEASRLQGKEENPFQRRLEDAIADPKNEDCSVLFNGEELQRLGVMDTLASSEELRKKFAKETGIGTDERLLLCNPASRYFFLSRIQSEVRRDFGLPPGALYLEWNASDQHMSFVIKCNVKIEDDNTKQAINCIGDIALDTLNFAKRKTAKH